MHVWIIMRHKVIHLKRQFNERYDTNFTRQELSQDLNEELNKTLISFKRVVTNYSFLSVYFKNCLHRQNSFNYKWRQFLRKGICL